MTKTIEGVPTAITRSQITMLIEGLGLDPLRVRSIAMDPGQVTVVVVSTGPDGRPFVRRDGGVAFDTIRIKVVPDAN